MKTCLHFLGSPLNIGSMALGQGGLSDEPMCEERVERCIRE